MEKSREETILLDAEIIGVLSKKAFRARLKNGHELVVYRRSGEGFAPVPGERVKVRITPFDFSVGRMVEGFQQAGGS